MVFGAALTSLIAAIVIMGAWQYFSSQAAEGRRGDLGKITKSLQKLEEEHSKAIEPLSKKLGELESQLTPMDPSKKLSDAEKTKLEGEISAVKKQIDEKPIDYLKAAQEFQVFFEKNPKHKEGLIAGVSAAGLLVKSEQLDLAESLIEKVRSSGKAPDLVDLQAALLQAQIQEQKGEFAKALSTLTAVESTAPKTYKPKVLMAEARLHMALQDKEKAHAALDKISGEFKDSPEAQLARGIKAWVY